MRFLGPVFWYDLVRVARRQPLALWRAGYGLALLAALFVLYATPLPPAWFGGHVSEKDATAFAHSLFRLFITLPFAALLLLPPAPAARPVSEKAAPAFPTSVSRRFIPLQSAAVTLPPPARAANAVAEERGHNTLSFLPPTPLTSREIVLGKLFPRLLVVGMLVATGLPVL